MTIRQAQPSAIELLEVVSAFLRDEAIPGLTGPAGFHARIAANAVAIVTRELALREKSAREEERRLQSLLGTEADIDALNRQLCAAIASDELSSDSPGLIDHLRATTLDDLAIDQPKYGAYMREMEIIGGG